MVAGQKARNNIYQTAYRVEEDIIHRAIDELGNDTKKIRHTLAEKDQGKAGRFKNALWVQVSRGFITDRGSRVAQMRVRDPRITHTDVSANQIIILSISKISLNITKTRI